MTAPVPPPAGLAGMHPAYFALVWRPVVSWLELMCCTRIAVLCSRAPRLLSGAVVLLIARVGPPRSRVGGTPATAARSASSRRSPLRACRLAVPRDRENARPRSCSGRGHRAVGRSDLHGVRAVRSARECRSRRRHGVAVGVVRRNRERARRAVAPSLGEQARGAGSRSRFGGGGCLPVDHPLLFNRYTFSRWPLDLAPPLYHMGAASDLDLAGTMLFPAAPHSPCWIRSCVRSRLHPPVVGTRRGGYRGS